MSGVNTDRPWLPAEMDDTFDPLSHADVEIDTETPMAVTPRGGAREVGRSCYQVDTQFSTTGYRLSKFYWMNSCFSSKQEIGRYAPRRLPQPHCP